MFPEPSKKSAGFSYPSQAPCVIPLRYTEHVRRRKVAKNDAKNSWVVNTTDHNFRMPGIEFVATGMNLGKTLNLSSSSGGRSDDTTVITGRLARTKKLPILTDQQPFSRLRRQRRRGQVAKAMDCKSIIRGFESHRRLSLSQKPCFSAWEAVFQAAREYSEF